MDKYVPEFEESLFSEASTEQLSWGEFEFEASLVEDHKKIWPKFKKNHVPTGLKYNNKRLYSMFSGNILKNTCKISDSDKENIEKEALKRFPDSEKKRKEFISEFIRINDGNPKYGFYKIGLKTGRHSPYGCKRELFAPPPPESPAEPALEPPTLLEMTPVETSPAPVSPEVLGS